ncbi:ABC transporter ATP-binding protein [Candidatus Saccharibacteria bacterium]|nr:ABC transporter ATP-binding protein [Candidatus Saccharibacteria bacterium]
MNDITVSQPAVKTPAMCHFVDVSKTFKLGDHTVDVLFSVSFDVPAASFSIIHGPSGSGKSTILNTLIGLEPPTSGNVCIDGVDFYKLSADERASFRAETIGMVHQDNYWVNSLSAVENVALPLLLAGWHKKKALILANQSIQRVGLEQYAHYNPTVLSGGQQQRISFARATITRPKLLVADEPTGNLDTKTGDHIVSLLQQFNTEYKTTIVLVTHNLDLLKLGDNDISIQDGRVVDTNNHTKKQNTNTHTTNTTESI